MFKGIYDYDVEKYLTVRDYCLKYLSVSGFYGSIWAALRFKHKI